MTAGRSCPLSYRYGPAVFNRPASVDTDTLYVVGGLYGNVAALATVVAMFEAEPGRKHLIFNGDFNWFNVDDDSFQRINETVLSFDATRGNVETELDPGGEADADTGCGCSYPDWVDDATVHRSNTIIARLAATAARFPLIRQKLLALPMHRRIDVAGVAVGVVHGDPESLAGWGFAAETLREPATQQQARTWFDDAGVRIFASSHTCSPILLSLADSAGRECVIANNGAAGMPNFVGRPEGLLTRISCHPSRSATASATTCVGDLIVEALPIRYDLKQAQQAFLREWPPGSAAHISYWQRIAGATVC